MYKAFLTAFFTVFIFFFMAFSVSADSNNKFGIHLAQPGSDDIQKAAELVNSNGGDWGYVTLVLQENDRDKNKWQNIFDELRRAHLIPIIRVATNPEGAHWRRPDKNEAEAWANFLNSLNWVVKERYIILFNEPNHAAEWGGSVDAQGYAEVAKAFAQKLKEKNSDFFVMLAGIDASAPNSQPFYMDEQSFLQTVISSISPGDFNTLFDGLSSHSYPNPGFSGSPSDRGKGTIRTYEWELSFLHDLGIKDLPVFITETGWSAERLSRDDVASRTVSGFRDVWEADNRVVAVTPFVLSYQGEPFLAFSWKQFQSDEFYPQYFAVQSVAKSKGQPEQREKGRLITSLPKELVAQSTYHLTVGLKNEGQGFWDSDGGYKLVLEDIPLKETFFSDIKNIAPFFQGEVGFYLKTENNVGRYEARVSLLKNNVKIVDDAYWSFEVLPLPDMNFGVSLYPKVETNGNDFKIQIFDEKEGLVYEQSSISVRNRKGIVRKIQNIALGRTYRVVLLRPYYLPRQEFVVFKKDKNVVQFKELLPFDFDGNGGLGFGDLAAIITHPDLLRLLLP